jgi:hypothetical protein
MFSFSYGGDWFRPAAPPLADEAPEDVRSIAIAEWKRL